MYLKGAESAEDPAGEPERIHFFVQGLLPRSSTSTVAKAALVGDAPRQDNGAVVFYDPGNPDKNITHHGLVFHWLTVQVVAGKQHS